MVSVLNLEQRPDRQRHDEDAHLDLDFDGRQIRLLFELKSAAENQDFGTGRDTGMPQLRRWARMHFVFGWFTPRDNVPRRLWYGSPAMMRTWNRAEQDYLAPDLLLTEMVPELIDDWVMERVLGDKDVYTFADLRRLVKDHWNAKAGQGLLNRYVANADVRRASRAADCLYSREMALEAVRDRARYLLARGSTVNNRKISRAYVLEHCQEITGPQWALNLYRAVQTALAAEPPAHE